MSYTVGQRWISHAEVHLGLGIIAEVSGRLITLSYPATGEERTYARDNAPISRVAYRVGDQVTTMDDIVIEVTGIRDYDGLLVYQGIDADGGERRVSELELDCFVKFTTPQQRLFSGQFDSNSAFELRVETLSILDRLQRSPVRGLLGARTSLLPHQVYIASEVSRRHAPRVMLADEVGLGKTIEAGMILHQQLLTGMAGRVLILVPPSLVHQWLVEMLRRFNLRFALFDGERLAALAEGGGTDNPFEAEQLVLCSLDLLAGDDCVLTAAAAAPWDLLVVDEAQHLAWSPARTSAEYAAVEQLSGLSKGLLLLTATPEQVGLESHFARLRLLDPARYHDLERFRHEESGYSQLNQLLQQILQQGDPVSSEHLHALRPYLGEAPAQLPGAEHLSAEAVVARLLDRFGTGRVMFRNTRAAIPAFPQRRLLPWPLPRPDLYRDVATGADGLWPELEVDESRWLQEDPRVQWLAGLVRARKPDKILVICAHASTTMALERYLHLRAGIRTAAFYEGLSIVERDRAAAYFADTEAGAQVLVCSEIGSEGRNFQFSHHLVLYDLPLNPDLLEQRIGRLDRIGQKQDICVHVPYLEGTAQSVLFRWYAEGMDLFCHSFSAGTAVYERFAPALLLQMHCPDAGLEALLRETREHTEALRRLLAQGRDPLLELNSCNPKKAAELITAIEASESESTIDAYLELAFDALGVDQEHHSDHALVLRPGEHLVGDAFSGWLLPLEEGLTVTSHRDLALVREDMLFLSWEHPLVTGVMDFIAGGHLGNAAVTSLKLRGIAPGTLLVEAIFAVHCPAPPCLQLGRYLSLNPVRFLLDGNGKDLDALISHEQLSARCQKLSRTVAQGVINRVRETVVNLLESIAPKLEARIQVIKQAAGLALQRALSAELERLRALQAVNPAIRPQEIAFLEGQLAAGLAAIEHASLQPQALRLIVTTS